MYKKSSNLIKLIKSLRKRFNKLYKISTLHTKTILTKIIKKSCPEICLIDFFITSLSNVRHKNRARDFLAVSPPPKYKYNKKLFFLFVSGKSG